MDKELVDKLVKACPNLYKDMWGDMGETCMAWGIDTGNGWFKLIWDVSKKLEKMIKKMPKPEGGEERYCRAAQVKEKFGTLRFYMTCETEEMSKAISKAERLSETTCEECGKKGKLREGGWLVTLCEKCWEKEKERREGNK